MAGRTDGKDGYFVLVTAAGDVSLLWSQCLDAKRSDLNVAERERFPITVQLPTGASCKLDVVLSVVDSLGSGWYVEGFAVALECDVEVPEWLLSGNAPFTAELYRRRSSTIDSGWLTFAVSS